MSLKTYLLSLPERMLRSTVGLGAGTLREVGEVAIPRAVRRSQLYQNLVETTLRVLIEQVGGVEGAYERGEQLGGPPAMRSSSWASWHSGHRQSGSWRRCRTCAGRAAS